jgi:Histidine kinase-, DNA gyrase B-, and HSP90-like ATPase
MHFLIVRKLTKSELGWFGEFRRLGRETSRQRGINFDADVVERVFPTAQRGTDINLSLRFRGDDGIKKEIHPLKRQHKNWRLVGEKIEDKRFGTVNPGDLFLLTIDAIGATPECAFIIAKAGSDLARFVMGCSQTSGLGRAGMIALHSSESGNLEQHLAIQDQELFGDQSMEMHVKSTAEEDEGPLTDGDLLQPPEAGRTIEAFSNIGHDLNVAVADLIDNSIEAGARNVEVSFPNPNDHGRILAIIDDGTGMKPRELARKMRIGTSRKYGEADLGKYGLGLKAASLSQARAVIVASRTKDTATEILAWDKKHISETGNWMLIRPELDERRVNLLREPLIERPGTVVLWDDMIPPRNRRHRRKKTKSEDISAHGLECLQLVRHLGKVFHRFIEGKARGKQKLNLTVNGSVVEPLDPLVGWHTGHQRLRTESILIPSGADTPDEIVEIHPVIIPGSTELESDEARAKVGFWGKWQKSQGFYFYRNDRIIQDGGWCGLWIEDPHYQLLRVAVNLNGKLDRSFGINVAKMTVQPPAFFTTQITSLLAEARAEAKRRYSPAGRKTRRKKQTKPHPVSLKTPPPDNVPPSDPPSEPKNTPGTPSLTEPEPARDMPSLYLIPLRGKVWRCRSDAIGNEVVELDASLPEASALHDALSAHPVAATALTALLKAIDTDENRQKVLAAWEKANG